MFSRDPEYLERLADELLKSRTYLTHSRTYLTQWSLAADDAEKERVKEEAAELERLATFELWESPLTADQEQQLRKVVDDIKRAFVGIDQLPEMQHDNIDLDTFYDIQHLISGFDWERHIADFEDVISHTYFDGEVGITDERMRERAQQIRDDDDFLDAFLAEEGIV